MKKTAKPEINWLSDITLVGVLCEMESARNNEVPKHKISVYRNGLHYNVISQHEQKEYLVELTNNGKGDDGINLHFTVPFGFEATIIGENE